jgi:hypothetical protein
VPTNNNRKVAPMPTTGKSATKRIVKGRTSPRRSTSVALTLRTSQRKP